MSSYWECHDDAVANAIHQERYGDVGELSYDCPYCFGHEVFKHTSSDDLKCGGCDRMAYAENGTLAIWEEHKALREDDLEHAMWMIPQWPSDRALPEPYKHLEHLRKVAS